MSELHFNKDPLFHLTHCVPVQKKIHNTGSHQDPRHLYFSAMATAQIVVPNTTLHKIYYFFYHSKHLSLLHNS